MDNQTISSLRARQGFPLHGWLGLSLIAVFWLVNWGLAGPRTHWAFFPLWLGFCLTIDGLVYARKGTSLLTRSPRRYIGLFLLSAPVWWLFELINARLDNWFYQGGELFPPLQYWFWATLSFTTVIPAVFGAAELFSSLPFFQRSFRGPKISGAGKTPLIFFLIGWLMLAAMLVWPRIFFPFAWLSLFFILEPVNIWLGYHSITQSTGRGEWRPVLVLWAGVLLTALFWEMWNYFSYPKWIYQIPWGGWLYIFEMPLLGYGGYLPFALELYAVYHFVLGLLGYKQDRYWVIIDE